MLEKVIKFVMEKLEYDDELKIRNAILEHKKYGTIDCEFDSDGEVMFVCRWNIDGETAHVLDFAVAEKWRGIKTLKYVLLKNLIRFPYVKYLSFERERKYPGRKQKVLEIRKIVKEL